MFANFIACGYTCKCWSDYWARISRRMRWSLDWDRSLPWKLSRRKSSVHPV